MPFLVASLWTLIIYLSSVKGSFVVDVTQSSYQAEENHNITLEWTFTTKPDTPISALKIRCRLITDQKPSTLYYLYYGVEFSEVQDEEFSGRVQSDKDALREGRIRLQLSRLRTEDSGLYLCEVDTGYGRGYNSCRVTVSDTDFAKTSTTETSLQNPAPQKKTPTNAGRSWVPVVIVVITVPLVLALAGFAAYFSFHILQKLKQKHPEDDETQKQPLPV
ncbi:uncharacterized protein LOC121813057 isoform X1 [Haplochromis burtoni]|uniref:uncharacterized protein LOC121813057 isoform X1 n=1 Tax=Haplochromis burtoni TaxID=8153 RepID=UPI001C2D8E64|nr:uncharacterized protein LOC121813057 isoform X1 [Haplochromis burtoni]